MTTSTAQAIPQWTLGDRLRKAREHAGLEQAELADRIGISRGTVGNYELSRGQRPPKVVVLRAWASECGVPYEWLVDGFRGPGVRHQGLEPRTRWLRTPPARWNTAECPADPYPDTLAA